jgi:peptidoglycan/LPS O-acetylase OafA/YrhL
MYGANPAEVKHFVILTLCYWTNSTGEKGLWGNTWSLSCEEQFYVMWALSLPFILPRRIRVRFAILATLIGLSLGLQIMCSTYEKGIWKGIEWKFGLLTNIWKLLLGSSIRLIPMPPCRRRLTYIGLAGLVASLVCTVFPPDFSHSIPAWRNGVRPMCIWVDVCTAICTSLILCGLSEQNSKGFAILELHPVRFVGRISYALYLWQYPMIKLNNWRRGYTAAADTAMAFVIAMCSTIYLEEPINKAYKRWKTRKDETHKISYSVAQA